MNYSQNKKSKVVSQLHLCKGTECQGK